MKKRLLIALLAMLVSTMALHAQRRIIVFDPELSEPVRAVTVWPDHNKADTTNILGQVSIPEKFDTLYISKSGYVALRIPRAYVEDSIPLIRDYNHIGEVVVYGEKSDNLDNAVKHWTKEEQTEATCLTADNGATASTPSSWKRSSDRWTMMRVPSYRAIEEH